MLGRHFVYQPVSVETTPLRLRKTQSTLLGRHFVYQPVSVETTPLRLRKTQSTLCWADTSSTSQYRLRLPAQWGNQRLNLRFGSPIGSKISGSTRDYFLLHKVSLAILAGSDISFSQSNRGEFHRIYDIYLLKS